MGSGVSALKPQELSEFRQLNVTQVIPEMDIPERPENRKPTNQKHIVICIIFIIFLFPFLIYTLIYSDIRRVFFAVDTCGNLCGYENANVNGIPCSGKDMTHKKYLKFDKKDHVEMDYSMTFLYEARNCVKSCGENYHQTGRFCTFYESDTINNVAALDDLIKKGFSNLGNDLLKLSWIIVLTALISIAIGIGMLLLFRHASALAVWSLIVVNILAIGMVAAFFWFGYIKLKNQDSSSPHIDPGTLFNISYVAVIFSIFFIIMCCVVIFMFKRIKLVIMLFKEASKAVFAMPGLISVPIVSAIVVELIIFLVVYTTIEMSTAGILQQIHQDGDGKYYDYRPNGVMTFTIYFNMIVAFWAIQFITGIQYMVIAGAVSKWFFAKNKSFLMDPISTSVKVVFKFHLGTVAFGSLIITLIATIRGLVRAISENENLKNACTYCMPAIVEDFVKYLSKNAYIQTAMHGQPFIRSGKRAGKLIAQNIANIIAINCVGDFVLSMAQMLLIIISCLVGGFFLRCFSPDDVSYLALGTALFIIIIISVFTSIVCFGVFETTIDTIFICFCEDSMMNDGLSRPYAMSTGLMEFMENSKKIIPANKKKSQDEEVITA